MLTDDLIKCYYPHMTALINKPKEAKLKIDRLKRVVQATGFTQVQISQELGVSFATVNNWLCERTTPKSMNQLNAIDAFLNRFKNIK